MLKFNSTKPLFQIHRINLYKGSDKFVWWLQSNTTLKRNDLAMENMTEDWQYKPTMITYGYLNNRAALMVWSTPKSMNGM